MSFSEDQRYYLKLKALSYLYEEGLSKTNIAKHLNISRVTLDKLLDEAKAEGMIKYEIIDVRGQMKLVQVEKEMCRTFGLRDIRLVDSGQADEKTAVKRIAAEGAAYVSQILRSNMRIGLTWGRTLSSMIHELKPDARITGLTVYTLVGGASTSSNFQPNLLAQQFISKYDGQAVVMTAPFMCQREELCTEIKKEPSIAHILHASREVDVTLVGIGEEPEKGADRLSDYPFDKKMIQQLVKAKAVGDICGNFFDIDGNLCDTPLRNRIVSIDIRDLLSHKWVIGIGRGEKKTRSILGALNGGYLDVLITDLQTATRVLAEKNAGGEVVNGDGSL